MRVHGGWTSSGNIESFMFYVYFTPGVKVLYPIINNAACEMKAHDAS